MGILIWFDVNCWRRAFGLLPCVWPLQGFSWLFWCLCSLLTRLTTGTSGYNDGRHTHNVLCSYNTQMIMTVFCAVTFLQNEGGVRSNKGHSSLPKKAATRHLSNSWQPCPRVLVRVNLGLVKKYILPSDRDLDWWSKYYVCTVKMISYVMVRESEKSYYILRPKGSASIYICIVSTLYP